VDLGILVVVEVVEGVEVTKERAKSQLQLLLRSRLEGYQHPR
jgi:hypothetical protein